MKHSMVPPLLPKINGPHLRSVFADDAADDAYDDAVNTKIQIMDTISPTIIDI